MYVEQIPVLQARESIMKINELGYAFGGMEKNAAASYIREINVMAEGSKPARTAHRPKSIEEMRGLTRSWSKGHHIVPEGS